MDGVGGCSMPLVGVIIFDDTVENNTKHLMCCACNQTHLGRGSVLKYFNCLHELCVSQMPTL